MSRNDRLRDLRILIPKLSDSTRGRVRENGLAHRLMAGAKRNRASEMESLIG